MGKLIESVKNRWRKQNRSADSTTSPVTSALRENPGNSTTPDGRGNHGRLVVVGRESEFPRGLVDYALEMAERLSYEIVALNTAPLSGEKFNFLSSSRNKLCQDFRGLSEKSATEFQAEVTRRGLGFTHVVKFCETDDALKELENEIGGIDFIVSDVAEAAVQEAPREGSRLHSEIVVYAMVK